MRAAKGKAGALQCCYDGDDDDDHDYDDAIDDDDDHDKKNHLGDGDYGDFGVRGCIGMYLTKK